MQAAPDITALWTLAVALSGLLSALLIDATLKRRYTLWLTGLGWAATLALGYASAYLSYSYDITNDFVGIIGISVMVWAAAVLLYERSSSGKLFVAIMATLIANVTTFFFCGTTLSFVDSTPNPYNIDTIATFMGIKLVWFTIFFCAYFYLFRQQIMLMLDTLDGRMQKYLPNPVVSFFGFYGINMITNHLGIFPGVPGMRYVFIMLYGIICLIFVFEFGQTVSSVFWSARALKTEAELNIASKIQKDMLPGVFPAFPERAEFDVYAIMEPAKEVGGDFYDFFLVDDTHLAVVIADVSGKGVPAAMFMVVAKTLIKNQTQPGMALGDVFSRVNDQLCENNNEAMFVTAFMGVLDLVSGRFEYVNAGHNPPLLKLAQGGFQFLKVKPGFVLAGMEDMPYRSDGIILHEGDRVYLYTDGVTEATNSSLKLYGEDRLLATLNRGKSMALPELLHLVKHDIDEFVGEADQFDDITMLALEYRQKGSSSRAGAA